MRKNMKSNPTHITAARVPNIIW